MEAEKLLERGGRDTTSTHPQAGHRRSPPRRRLPNAQFISDGLRGYLARIHATKRATLLSSLAQALVREQRLHRRRRSSLRECIEALELVAKNLDLFEAESQMAGRG